jgi:membrane-bound lytic murein transglycosylase D
VVKSEPAAQVAEKKDLNQYYTVKKGDTLYSLARRFKVTTAILSAWNNLTEKVALRPGKRIIVAKQSAEDNG